MRGIWSKYYSDANGLIFIVDSNSTPERMEEAKETLRGIAAHPDLSLVPFLLCANKQDQPNSASVSQVDECIAFSHQCGKTSRQHAAKPVSALTGAGLESAIQWIVDASREFGPRPQLANVH